MTDVWKLNMDAHRKLILLSLADNASDDGQCWPSQPTIARRSSISERQLRDHLHALAADGWISVVSLGNGRGHSTKYLLNVVQIKAAKAEADAIKGGGEDDERRRLEAIKAEAASRQTVIESSIEPSSEPEAVAADFPLIVRAFEDLCGSISGTIIQRIGAELDEGTSPEWIIAACEEAALHNGRSWSYVEKILQNWHRNGFKAQRKGLLNGRQSGRTEIDPYADLKPVVRPAHLREVTQDMASAESEAVDEVPSKASANALEAVEGT